MTNPTTTEIELHCTQFPGISCLGYPNIYVGYQSKQEIVDAVAGNSQSAFFSIPVKVKQGKDSQPDFYGPNVHGKVGDRFLYLVWFSNGVTPERFRRAKIKLNHLRWHDLTTNPKATMQMTDKRGGPICATVPPDFISWA